MKVTQRQLRKLINEEVGRLIERGEFGFKPEPLGSERKIKAGEHSNLSKAEHDMNMVGRALEKFKDAVLDQDEDEAARWVQKAQHFSKLAYDSLLVAK